MTARSFTCSAKGHRLYDWPVSAVADLRKYHASTRACQMFFTSVPNVSLLLAGLDLTIDLRFYPPVFPSHRHDRLSSRLMRLSCRTFMPSNHPRAGKPCFDSTRIIAPNLRQRAAPLSNKPPTDNVQNDRRLGHAFGVGEFWPITRVLVRFRV
ncbi:hypothetical protein HBH61_150140 [Parastagonospora nodorum]|nr:hypothetical protein HBH61_150140 [Parastagonospora nodorum]